MGKIGKVLGLGKQPFTSDWKEGDNPGHRDNKRQAQGINAEDIDGVIKGSGIGGSATEGDMADMEPQSGMPDSGSMTSQERSPEMMAMSMFEKATTPQAKVDALKAFGEACGWGGMSEF